MRKTRTIAGIVAATASLAGVAVGFAAPANAHGYDADVHTFVMWGGSRCLDVAYQNGAQKTYCGNGNSSTYRYDSNGIGHSGSRIYLDPIMGNADWISCTIEVNGYIVVSDYASAGDGHDAWCATDI
ncbi:hypothetical protein [Aldersonia kunmingensis]|uniref:hypothetical protein n=1 Tax=Aldersonia kunmingensis TaxID=408066 RepID=UPI000830A979|nr:hypothetical protein [Aldersonia kunmingensis]